MKERPIYKTNIGLRSNLYGSMVVFLVTTSLRFQKVHYWIAWGHALKRLFHTSQK
jgi:hypothetical protein